MKQFTLLCLSFIGSFTLAAQTKSYKAQITAFQKKCVADHEVVKGADKKALHFFPVSKTFMVNCSFEKSTDSSIVPMKTSGTKIPVKDFVRYGKLNFTIHDTTLQLTIYKSMGIVPAEYKDYLFIPFTDLTSGEGSYAGGRYIDIKTGDINNNKLVLDFNKAYNPYCAYTTGFNCPIPPRENDLGVAVVAGERTFGKTH